MGYEPEHLRRLVRRRGRAWAAVRFCTGICCCMNFWNGLNRRYPDLLIEGCSGGGGRFDAGCFYYAPQIWCSDNTDAVDRLAIQYGTSFGYPVSAVGSYVSAVPTTRPAASPP